VSRFKIRRGCDGHLGALSRTKKPLAIRTLCPRASYPYRLPSPMLVWRRTYSLTLRIHGAYGAAGCGSASLGLCSAVSSTAAT
jgi:hypothetical protein